MPGSSCSPEGPLAAAVLLGWRVAELYALVDDTGTPASDTLLPATRASSPPTSSSCSCVPPAATRGGRA